MCGIGTYTKYLTDWMREDQWRVITFRPDEFSIGQGRWEAPRKERIHPWITLEDPSLPEGISEELLWFQHSFGMWGRVNTHFLKLIEEGKRRGKKVGASFHTIHFQSDETPWGMQEKERDLLREALPVLDFATVFTSGARKAVIETFPQYREKVLVLRHGVHRYPAVSQKKARRRLFSYLIQTPFLSEREKSNVIRLERSLSNREAILIGNFGFITQDKDPIQLYEVGTLLQKKLPHQRIVTLFIGKIQERKDKKRELSVPILEKLKSLHDGESNLFYEDFLPEEIFPFAFRALDVAVFWCNNATQSGRMAHAQGTGVAIAGRDLEGIGETLRLSGLPSSQTMEELSEKIAEILTEPTLRREMEERSEQYAQRFSFSNQAQKHLQLEQALLRGNPLPLLDGESEDDLHLREISHRRFEGFRVSRGGGDLYSQCS
jgi:glycosyltransferase involved in cell wall biosynthesis